MFLSIKHRIVFDKDNIVLTIPLETTFSIFLHVQMHGFSRVLSKIILSPSLLKNVKEITPQKKDRRNLFFAPQLWYCASQKPVFSPKSEELFQFTRDFRPAKN